ncbi:hypothetical protein ACFLW2_04405 [Chloroflexota bacterium]
MKWNDLIRLADEEKIKRSVYSLERDREDYQFVLGRLGPLWTVYYFERGEKIDKKFFFSEDKACRFLLNTLLEDPGTREGWPTEP